MKKGKMSLRDEMIRTQLAARGIRNHLVLRAVRNVPREEFLSEHLRKHAYADVPLPIAGNQTMSQPFMVAYMIESLALTGGEKVLEIGTGSGYAAAVLAEIVKEVHSVERIAKLANQAKMDLKRLCYFNVHVYFGDGTRGWPEESPFDAIVVAAAGPVVPEALKSQLKIGGRMVIPVGTTADNQKLTKITRLSRQRFQVDCFAGVRFVPLIGEEGWEEVDEPYSKSCLEMG